MDYKLVRANAILSIATVPIIAILLGLKAWENTMQDVGQVGEEAFRGSRLPLLNFTGPGPKQ